MRIDVRRWLDMFFRYGLSWQDVAYILDAPVGVSKMLLTAKTICLEQCEAERLLKYLTAEEVLIIMPIREGVMAFARM